ncbi:MAG: 30S ribosomal protein S11 [Candidatus Woesebacteria bacterium]
MATPTIIKQAPKKQIPRGRIYIQATFNNTIVTITDENGDTVCWGSSGNAGFSGSRKSTPYAATVTVEKAVDKSKDYGMKHMDVYIKGPGPGRDAVLRVIRAKGIRVGMIADVTPIPHNGTKPRKRRHG